MIRTVKFSLATLLVSLVAIAAPSKAFQLDPISQTFKPSGAAASKTYRIINTNNQPIAVEISILKREIDLKGDEQLSPAADDFIVYPSQILLDAKGTQSVRVTWVGDPKPTSELAYRLVAEQLPLTLKPDATQLNSTGETTAAMKVLMRYAGSLYIQPDQAQPKLIVQSTQLERDSNGKPWLSIHIKNQGNARQTVADPRIQLTGGGQTITLNSEDLEVIQNRTILAGGDRRFSIPWPSGLPEGTVTGTLTSISK